MNQLPALISWGISTIIIFLAVFYRRQQRRQNAPIFEDFVVIAASTAGLFVGIKVTVQAFTDPILLQRLEWDGAIALVIGAAFTCYLGLREIIKFFQNP
jgi:hypothetical protein